MFISKHDVIVHEIAYGLNALPALWHMSEQAPGLLAQKIGFAVAASHQINQRFIRQVLNPMLDSISYDRIRQAAVADDGICRAEEGPWRSKDAVAPIAELIVIPGHAGARCSLKRLYTFQIGKS